MNKCVNCEFGANQVGYRGSIYKFKMAIKKRDYKIVEINYNNNENGCRRMEWNDKERECLKNNFSKFKEFVIV